MNIRKYESEESFPRERYYTIGDLSRLYHIGADTLRYYEEKGVLHPVRGENGYRYYDNQNMWRMNVIMNLRSLGFSVERIGSYLENRTVESTQALLSEELGIIEEKQRELEAMRQAVQEQLKVLRDAQTLDLGRIRIREYPSRQAIEIKKKHSTDQEMDLLMKRLVDETGDKLYIIGNNRIASVISQDEEGPVYDGALLFDPSGELPLPGGTYLSVCYSGATNSRHYARMLQTYAREHALTLRPPCLDLVWIDIHATSNQQEFISEVQVRVEL